MEKTYQYKKHRVTIMKFLIIFLFFWFLICLLRYWAICSRSDFAEFLRKELSLPLRESPLITVLYFIVCILCGILILRMSRSFSLKSIQINDLGIVYKDYKKEIHIAFEEITRFDCGLRFKISTNKGKIIMMQALDNVEDFLMEMKTALDKRGMSDRYNKKKLLVFMKQAMISKHLHEILAGIRFLHLVPAMVSFLCVATFFGLIAGIGMKFIGVWLLVSLLHFVLAFCIYIFILFGNCAYRMKKETDPDSFIFPSRNPELEKHMQLKTIFWSGLVYVVLTMGFFLSAPFWITIVQ